MPGRASPAHWRRRASSVVWGRRQRLVAVRSARAPGSRTAGMQNAPPGREAQVGGSTRTTVGSARLLSTGGGYWTQRCWVPRRLLRSNAVITEPAPSVVDGPRLARDRDRISDTRDLRVPARTKVGTALSVSRDIAARPFQERTRVRGARTIMRRTQLEWRLEMAMDTRILLREWLGA